MMKSTTAIANPAAISKNLAHFLPFGFNRLPWK